MELVVEGLRGEPLRTEDRIWIFSDNEQARLVIKQILDQRFGPQSSSSGYFVFSPRTKLTVVDWGSGGGAMGRVRKYSVDFLVPTD
ncbi:MAG TPA: hypothetical protein VD971_11425 [Phycisphaerales bacterium]|nr:hypothetical protein [Phycisphaerales bacterium]